MKLCRDILVGLAAMFLVACESEVPQRKILVDSTLNLPPNRVYNVKNLARENDRDMQIILQSESPGREAYVREL